MHSRKSTVAALVLAGVLLASAGTVSAGGEDATACPLGCPETTTQIGEKPQPPSLRTDISEQVSNLRSKFSKNAQTAPAPLSAKDAIKGPAGAGPTSAGTGQPSIAAMQGAAQESQAPETESPKAAPALTVDEAYKPSVVYPEKTTPIFISNQNQNRFVCLHGDITDIYTSQEKGVKVELNGHEAYVKLEFEVSGQNINYSEIPTEFFIRCGDETFAIIANPRSLPPQTVHMVAPVKKNPDDITLEEASVDKAVVQIFKDVFADKIPQSWDRAKNIYGESKINGIDVVPRTAFYIPGVDVVVNIFGLKTSLAAVPLSEADFLVPELATNPVAIAFNDEDFILSAQDNISLVIIEKTVKER